MAGWYDTAQVCLNGHVITDRASSAAQHMRKFCDKCGEATITKCPHCQRDIQGDYHSDVVFIGGDGPTAAAFCHECGKPFPWTEAGLKAAQELAGELSGLTSEEREALAKSLPDLLRETPRTGLAATRFKRLVTKAGPVALEGFRKLLVDFGVAAAKEVIFGKQ